MKPKIILCLAPVFGSLHAATWDTDHPSHTEDNGLACTLIVPTPYRIHFGRLEIQVVLKNVSAAPIRVCTLCGRWGGSGKDWSDAELGPGNILDDSPTIDQLAQAVVSIPPGASLTLSSDCDIPETTPFRLTAGYGTQPDMAKQLNTWQGRLRSEPVMIDIKPHAPVIRSVPATNARAFSIYIDAYWA